MLFYAYIKFLIFNNGDPRGLHQWMRIVHNLTVNVVIDSADLIARAMTVINELLKGSKDILTHLAVSGRPMSASFIADNFRKKS